MESHNDGTVYHYCSMDVFIQIISKQSIRLTDVFGTNDKQEFIWAKNFFLKALESHLDDPGKRNGIDSVYDILFTENHAEYIKNEQDLDKLLTDKLGTSLGSDYINLAYQNLLLQRKNSISKDEFYKNAECMVNREFDQWINNFDREFTYRIASSIVPHIACFSSECDLLSQWRAYADNGHGVAIGFNFEDAFPTSFSDIKHDCSDKLQLFDITKEAVDYSEYPLPDLLNKLEVGFSPFLLGFSFSIEPLSEDINQILFQKLEEFGTKHKNPFFKEEKESRICANAPAIYKEQEGGVDADACGFYYKNGQMRSYISRHIPVERCPNCIRELYLGPKCTAAKVDIYRIMNQYGFTIAIEDIKRSRGANVLR